MGLYLTPCIISAHLPTNHGTVYLTPCMISAHLPRIQETRKCLLDEKYTRFHYTRGSLSFVLCQAPLLPLCLTPCIISAHLPKNYGTVSDPLYHFSPSAHEPWDCLSDPLYDFSPSAQEPRECLSDPLYHFSPYAQELRDCLPDLFSPSALNQGSKTILLREKYTRFHHSRGP